MHHTDILKTAAATLNARGDDYGDAAVCFDKIAMIAGTILNRPVTPYEVSIFHIATKLGRAATSPGKTDTWVDLANYAAFAGQFSQTLGYYPAGNDPIEKGMADIVSKFGQGKVDAVE
jgi:hypothetical protein